MSLQTIETALLTCLTSGGVYAVAAFPSERMTRLTQVTTAVSLREAEAEETGMCQYLGETWNAVTAVLEVLYGKQVKLCFVLDIFSPRTGESGAAGCRQMFDTIAELLLTSAPAGLRIKRFSCGPVSFDKTVDAFRCRAEVHCTAYLCAAAADGGALLDFELRGVMQV